MRRSSRLLLVLCAGLLPMAARADEEGRTKSRLLLSFETGAEAKRLVGRSENSDLTTVMDIGVTQGSNCLRWTVRRGSDYGVIKLDPASLRGWKEYDYFAIDVTMEDEHPYLLALELWDKDSKNFATRCTFEETTTRAGRQTLLYPINRARRNNKEGRNWEELQARDKIDLDGLTQVKLFITPLKNRDAVLWVDNIRLLQEDAAKPKLKVPLPEGSIGFKFGSAGVKMPGFQTIHPKSKYAPGNAGFTGAKKLEHGGEGWPDLLAGTFIVSPQGERMTFRAEVPDGSYHVWLCAGPILAREWDDHHYRLGVNGFTIVDTRPSPEDYYSEKYLYRFLNTQYSEKPHALWDRYIDRMYPVHTKQVKVTDRLFSVDAVNYFLSAVVLVPVGAKAEWEKFQSTTRDLRRQAFAQTLRPLNHPKPVKKPDDGDFLVYEPEFGQTVRPWTGPTDAERRRTKIQTATPPGERVTVRLAVVPFADLGRCSLSVSNLKGPALIPARHVDVRFQNYRYDGDQLDEMVLLPRESLEVEKGVTQCFWLTLTVPPAAKAGTYHGQLTFRPGTGEPVVIPFEVEVYPFKLEGLIPVAYGMYYRQRQENGLAGEFQRRLVKEQLIWMRQVGFTSVAVGAPVVNGLGDKGEVDLHFDPTVIDLAREVGMARNSAQPLMATALSVGRGIGRRLPGSEGAAVDRNPGIELEQPEFRGHFLNAARQMRAFYQRKAVPVVVEVVDEPRETPNPWNRNLADTIRYAKMLREAGLTTFVTPMADQNQGKDYTVLADHTDIVSVHAWMASEKLMARTKEKGKTLWLYNTGMDRFSWGFYNWRAGSAGRWEWHFCWPEEGAQGGYPGQEWYNPFNRTHGLAPNAPPRFPGGMLFQSCFLDVAEGINDYTYLVTLQKALARRAGSPKHAATVKEARAFLAEMRKAIPPIPGLKGLPAEGDGALVGKGVSDDVRLLAPKWRATMARYLIDLNRD